MSLSESQRSFLEEHHEAAMITVARDGTAKVARVAVLLTAEGKLWSSGTEDRVRTARLRRDPRCTLYVSAPGWAWLALETSVRILDGPEVPRQSLQMFRQMQDQPEGKLRWFGGDYEEDEFLRLMTEERRIIYEFAVIRAYGMTG